MAMATPKGSGTTLLATRSGSQVDIWDISDWSLVNRFTGLDCGTVNSSPLSGVTISPDGSFFITRGGTKVNVYSMEDGSSLWGGYNPGGTLAPPELSADGTRFAYMNGTTKIVLDTSDWSQVSSITSTAKGSRECMALNSDGTKLAVGGTSNRIQIYDMSTSTGTVWSNDLTTTNDVWKLTFSPDDTLLASSQENATNSLQVMTVGTTLVEGSAFSVNNNDSLGNAFSPDGTLLGVTYYLPTSPVPSGSIVIYNVSDWSTHATLSVGTGSRYKYTISISQDNALTAVSQGGASPFLEIYNTSDLSLISSTPTISSSCNGVDFN
jgi:hypothetical protein